MSDLSGIESALLKLTSEFEKGQTNLKKNAKELTEERDKYLKYFEDKDLECETLREGVTALQDQIKEKNTSDKRAWKTMEEENRKLREENTALKVTVMDEATQDHIRQIDEGFRQIEELTDENAKLKDGWYKKEHSAHLLFENERLSCENKRKHKQILDLAETVNKYRETKGDFVSENFLSNIIEALNIELQADEESIIECAERLREELDELEKKWEAMGQEQEDAINSIYDIAKAHATIR